MLDGIRRAGLDLFAGLVRTQKAITPEERPRAYRLFVMDAGFWSGMNTLQSGPFLAAFALAIGATNYDIGLLTTIVFVGQLMQVPGIFLVQKFPRRRAICVLTSGTARLMWIPIVLIPFLFVDRGITFLLQFMLLGALIGGIPIPAWHSFMKDGVASPDLPGVLSRRTVWAVGVALALTLAGGVFVDLWKRFVPEAPLYAYSILFTFGIVFGLAGVAAIARLPEPRMRTSDTGDGLNLLTGPFRDANFVRLLKFVGPWSFTVHMAMPFFLVYLYKRLDFPVVLVTGLVASAQLSHMFFVRIWSPLISRFSSKSVMSVSGWLFLGSLLLWPLLTAPERHALTVPLAFLIYIIIGMSMAGLHLAANSVALKISPADKAHSYMSAFMITMAVAGVIAPMAGGTLSHFFAAREFGLTLTWSDPARAFAVPALSLKALDFLFLVAFCLGLFAMHRLRKFQEEGEGGRRKVVKALRGRVSTSIRIAISAENLRRIFPSPFR